MTHAGAARSSHAWTRPTVHATVSDAATGGAGTGHYARTCAPAPTVLSPSSGSTGRDLPHHRPCARGLRAEHRRTGLTSWNDEPAPATSGTECGDQPGPPRRARPDPV